MKKMIKLIGAILCLFSMENFAAVNPVYDWGWRANSGINGSAIVTCMDAEYTTPTFNNPAQITNIYIAGNFTGTITTPVGTMTASGTNSDIFIIRMTAAGTILNATALVSTATDDQVNDILVQRDGSGNALFVFITGKHNSRFLLAKYNPNLTTPLNNMVGTFSDVPAGFAVGRGMCFAGSNIAVAGYVTPETNIDFFDALGNTLAVSNNYNFKNSLVIKFNTSLKPLQQCIPELIGGDNEAYDIVSGGGRLFITGYYMSTIQFSTNPASALPSSSGARDIFLASLNMGSVIFDKNDQKKAGGIQINDANGSLIQDIGYSLSYYSSAVYLVGGVSANVVTTVDNAPSFTGSGFLAKFPMSASSNGNIMNVSNGFVCKFTRNTSTSLDCRPFRLGADPDGNMIVTGHANPGCAMYEANGITLISIPYYNNNTANSVDPCGFIAKYNSSGSLIWADRINQNMYNGTNVSSICGDAVLASKCNIYYGGQLSTAPSVIFGNNPPYTVSGAYNGCNAFVAKMEGNLAMSPNQTICSAIPATFNLSAIGSPNSTYTWSSSPSSGVTIVNGNTSNPTVTVNAPGVYTFTCTSSVTYNSNAICPSTGTCVVTVNPVVQADAGPDTCIFCYNFDCLGMVQLGVNPAPSSWGVTYSWSPTTGLSNSTIANPVYTHSGQNAFPRTFILTVTTVCGTTTDTVIISRCPWRNYNLDSDLIDEASLTGIYPNPSSGIFTISSEAQNLQSIVIKDALGRIVKEIENINSYKTEISLENENKGFYFVEVTYEGQAKPVYKKIILD